MPSILARHAALEPSAGAASLASFECDALEAPFDVTFRWPDVDSNRRRVRTSGVPTVVEATSMEVS
jgi:hypothetical protein